MGLYNKLPEDLKEVDIIIAGGGTAGCVVAGRLASADPNLSILVVEGGTSNYNVPNVVHPAFFLHHLAPGSTTNIFYVAKEEKQLAGRASVVPSGGILGGGSSTNAMMYTRAQRSDFNSWETPGWTTEELVPFLKKIETYHGPGDLATHGTEGPVHISDGGVRLEKSMNEFVAAMEAYGYPESKDVQDLDSCNAVQKWLRYVSPEGKRQDAAHTYLHPLLNDGKHANLHVLVEQKVVRVLFDGDKRANGVEFTPNAHYYKGEGNPEDIKQTVKARKLVVVSAGACGSPLVLERSGVGAKDVLERAGVPLVAEVPGVGAEYQDHNVNFFPYRSSLEPDETMDALFSNRITMPEAIASGTKLLGHNSIDAASKIRPTDAEVAALGPEFQAAWDRDFKPNPDKPLVLTGLLTSYISPVASAPPGQYFSVGNYTAYPYSRGHMHITGPRLTDPLDFEVGYFSDEGDKDVKKLVWAYKRSRELARRLSYYRGEVPEGQPAFDASSPAALVQLDKPLTEVLGVSSVGEIKDLEYSREDDAAIEQFLRKFTHTTWHSLGTCKMAPPEQGGSVDKDLNVYGVKGLKVVDLSIVPKNVGANTNNTALLVGEKGADIIARELGIPFSTRGRLVVD